jgi:hypothetical protein
VDGFTLGAYNWDSGAGFNSSCSGIEPAYSCSKYMLNCNSLIGVFDLNSIYARAWTGYNSTVTFLGLDGINGNVLYAMSVNVTNIWQDISFSNWLGVKTFAWDPANPSTSNIAIDNFEYNATAVPEPTSLTLMAIGLAGIGYSKRRKLKNITAI